MAAQQKTTQRYAAKVTTSDPSTSNLEVIIKQEVRNVSIYTLPAAFRWPEVGESVMVEQINGSWYLEGYQPQTNAFKGVDPGDLILSTPTGVIWIDQSEYDNETGVVAPLTQLDINATGKRYEASFGDGTSSSFTIAHNLGLQYVDVSIFNSSTLAEEYADIVCNSTTECTLSAAYWSSNPPSVNGYHVVVSG